jgi:hypothetical protein
MANSLLDFVISLVRDPEAAARYAANPAQAIADAHLTDVTSIDVNNLIPVVSDSLSMAGPPGGVTGMQVPDHGNVWASGAATAAFDAFAPPAPAGPVMQHGAISGVISQPHAPAASDVPGNPQLAGLGHHEPSVLVTGAEVADIAFDHGGFPVNDPGIWDHSVIHPDAHGHDAQPDDHGFGSFGVNG